MILKNLFFNTWNYSKALLFFIIVFILIHLFYNYYFARFAHLVDNHKPVSHPYGFEAFPFVVYNMYSGKMDDWNKYTYLKIEADGQELPLTDLNVLQEDQFVNPSQKFLSLRGSNFHDEALLSYLTYTFDSSERAARIYSKVNNEVFYNNEALWGNWMKRYLSKTLKREVKQVKIFDCAYSMNSSGKPEPIEQKLLFQFE